ncbi:TPA: hypothetical protein ACWWF3_002353 [Enterococcus faecalis]
MEEFNKLLQSNNYSQIKMEENNMVKNGKILSAKGVMISYINIMNGKNRKRDQKKAAKDLLKMKQHLIKEGLWDANEARILDLLS